MFGLECEWESSIDTIVSKVSEANKEGGGGEILAGPRNLHS